MKESGNITVLVLMVLAIMTLMAIASFEESITEVYLAKNELSKATSFYCAEAAIVEASSDLEDSDVADLQEIISNYNGRTLTWIHLDSQITDLSSATWKNVSDLLSTKPSMHSPVIVRSP
jgi:Tfp pilus assembly protein PilX